MECLQHLRLCFNRPMRKLIFNSSLKSNPHIFDVPIIERAKILIISIDRMIKLFLI